MAVDIGGHVPRPIPEELLKKHFPPRPVQTPPAPPQPQQGK